MHKYTIARLKGIRDNVDDFLDPMKERSLDTCLRNISDLTERIKVYEEVHKREQQIEMNLTRIQEACVRLVESKKKNRDQKDLINQVFQLINLHLYDEN